MTKRKPRANKSVNKLVNKREYVLVNKEGVAAVNMTPHEHGSIVFTRQRALEIKTDRIYKDFAIYKLVPVRKS